MTISTKQALAARKLLGAKLRKAGLPDDLENFRPESLEDKRAAHDAKNAVAKIARDLIDTIKDSTEEERTAEAEAAHDAMMHTIDMIEERITSLAGNPNRPGLEDVETRADGAPYISRTGWRDKEGNEVRVLAPNQRMSTALTHEGGTLGDAMRAMITGPRNEWERRVLAEGVDASGGFTVPKPLALEFIDRLRARSTVMQAGAQTVGMNSATLSMARLATDPTVTWRAENAEILPSDPTFESVQFTARSLGSLVKISRELLDDSVNVSQILMNALAKAFAVELDRVALFGTGVAPQPLGIANVAGIGSVSMGANGAALANFDPFVDAWAALAGANAAAPTAAIIAPRTAAALAKLKQTTNAPLPAPDLIANLPRLVTTSVPVNQTQGTSNVASSIIMGDFSELMIGLRDSLRIEILRERYAEFVQYGFVAVMRADVQVRHPASFAKVVGVL